jgi:hypothetical protein
MHMISQVCMTVYYIIGTDRSVSRSLFILFWRSDLAYRVLQLDTTHTKLDSTRSGN